MGKSICYDCKESIVINKSTNIPKFCCYCGSKNIYDEKTMIEKSGVVTRKIEELKEVSDKLNILYEQAKPLNKEYIKLIKEIRTIRNKHRTIIPQDEYIKITTQVKCIQFRQELKEQKKEQKIDQSDKEGPKDGRKVL